jgi:hypothetical protein
LIETDMGRVVLNFANVGTEDSKPKQPLTSNHPTFLFSKFQAVVSSSPARSLGATRCNARQIPEKARLLTPDGGAKLMG